MRITVPANMLRVRSVFARTLESTARIGLWTLLLLCNVVLAPNTRAQCDEVWTRFGGIQGIDGIVYAAAGLPGGDAIVGGQFSLAGSAPANKIARYNPVSKTWSALGSGLSGSNSLVRAIKVLANGDVVVGGQFISAGGIAASNIARYVPATDTWHQLGSGVNGAVYAIDQAPDGSILVAGQFTAAGPVAVSHIARFLTVSQRWAPLGNGISGLVQAVCVANNGDVIAGGNFYTAFGAPGNCIARFQSSTNAWQAMGAGIASSDPNVYPPFVTALTVMPNGTIIAAGRFTSMNGQPARSIAEYSGEWITNTTQPGNPATEIDALHADPSGGLWVAGPHVFYQYSPSDGTISHGFYGAIANSVTTLTNGDVLLGGSFDSIGGIVSNNIAVLSPASDTWSNCGTGSQGIVYTLASLPNGNVAVGGSFGVFGGALASSVAIYSSTAGAWVTADGGVVNDSGTSSYPGYVNSMAALPNGDLAVAGLFNRAGSVPVQNAALYSSATNRWTPINSGSTDSILAIAALPSGELLVAGTTSAIGGAVGSIRIARYSPSTGIFSALGGGAHPGPNGLVDAIVVLPDGDVVVAGEFNSVSGLPASDIARFSFVTNSWSAMGAGNTSGRIYALAALPNGDVVAGGIFTSVMGVPANHVAIYRASGNAWSALGAGTDLPVYALASLQSGEVAVGGTFQMAGGDAATYFALLDPAKSSWRSIAASPDSTVYALAQIPGADVALGGSFRQAGGGTSYGYARYAPGPSPLVGGLPFSVETCLNRSASFSVAISGPGPFSYVWRHNTVPISPRFYPSAATQNYVVPAVAASDVGIYDCVVANACGQAVSQPAMLTLREPGDPACDAPQCDPDVNQDGNADVGDIDYLINVVAGGTNPTGINPDFSGDGNVDQGDIDALIAVVAGGICP